MNVNELTLDFVQNYFEHDYAETIRFEHPSLGTKLRQLFIDRHITVVYELPSKQVLMMSTDTPHDAGRAFWVHPDYEVAVHKHDREYNDRHKIPVNPEKNHQVFNPKSMLEIMKAVRDDVEYDTGLLYDISLYLPYDLQEALEKRAKILGVPKAKLMVELLDSAIRSKISEPNSTKGPQTPQEPRTQGS